jgi:hypothetical protein
LDIGAGTGLESYQAIKAMGGNGVYVYNTPNTTYQALALNSSSEKLVVLNNGSVQGGVWNWADTNLSRGQINIRTDEPPATGPAGEIVLVYE